MRLDQFPAARNATANIERIISLKNSFAWSQSRSAFRCRWWGRWRGAQHLCQLREFGKRFPIGTSFGLNRSLGVDASFRNPSAQDFRSDRPILLLVGSDDFIHIG